MTTNPSQRLDHPPTHQQAAESAAERPQSEAPRPAFRDRVRWGPIWAGAVVAVPIFLVLQTLFFAVGATTIGPVGQTEAGSIAFSGFLGLIAFFLGGLMAGASSLWPSLEDGLLHGVLVWALTVVGILVLGLFGGGALLGPLANLVVDIGALQQPGIPGIPGLDPAQVAQQVQAPAGWTALSLGLAAAAAAFGGVAGSKIWPRRGEPGSPR